MKQDVPAGGFLHELGWLGMGFVLPCASLTFYRRAARRRLASALLFFLIFSLSVAGVLWLDLIRGMTSAQGDIRAPFETGQIPSIVIQDGVARADGPQRRVLIDDGDTIVMIDLTGTDRQLDRSRYRQGFLLTRTELHIMDNSGRYQVVSLRELQEVLGANPIVVSADTAARAWQVFAGLFTILGAVLLVVWNVLVRFVYLAALALMAWGFVSMAGQGIGYGAVLSVGLYAVVPSMYMSYLLARLGVSFIFLQTLILLPLWAIALWAIAPQGDKAEAPPERPLHGLRALAGVPLLVVLAVDGVFRLPYGGALVLGAFFVTLTLLLAAELLARRPASPGPADGAGATPATP